MADTFKENNDWERTHNYTLYYCNDAPLIKELYQLRLNELNRRIEELEKENLQLKSNSLYNDDNRN